MSRTSMNQPTSFTASLPAGQSLDLRKGNLR